jgi:glutathione gamma-glutamylcysteinyltransferase
VIDRTFYRRPLPPPAVAFAGAEGRRLFREALAEGTMEGWFPLAEQFHTQAEPAFCGLATLVMVLNALEIDPGRTWKGPWRWYSEEHLDCCRSLEDVAREGITLTQLACLAQCNGARASVSFADASSLEAFRAAVREAASSPGEGHVIVAYDRRALGQTGTGHFSPIGGLHPDRDLVLLLDVARFKYPPHWVQLEVLHRAMRSIDPASARSRGFAVVRRERALAPAAALRDGADWPEIERFLRDLDGTDMTVLAGCMRESAAIPSRLLELLRRPEGLPANIQEQVARLRAQMAALQDGSSLVAATGRL